MLAPFTQFKKINVRPSRLLIIFNVMREEGKCVIGKEHRRSTPTIMLRISDRLDHCRKKL